MTAMKPATIDAYDNLLRHYNKDVSIQITCECGKILNERILEKHLKTSTHAYLLHYKNECAKMKQQLQQPQPEQEPTKPKRQSTWKKIKSEVLSKDKDTTPSKELAV